MRWSHIPEDAGTGRSLDEQMWRILTTADRGADAGRRDHSIRVGLVVAALSVPLIGSFFWAAAYVLGIGVH